MPVADLLMEGVELMVLGMGTVFTFLMLLVVLMMGMSRLAHVLEPEETSAESSLTTAAGSGSSEDQQLVAVITAAVRRYRARHR